MQLADLPMVHQLELISQPAPWPRWFFRRQLRSDASCWVLEVNKEIIGFGIVTFVKGWAHIMNMCVAPAYRQQGLGLRILQHLLHAAGKRRCRWAWLEVRYTNLPAVSLYRKLGFRITRIRKGYYRTRQGLQDGLVMVRPIRSSSTTFIRTDH